MNKPMVDILLATYNGSMFLREQIDSLFKQTYKNIRICIRDDGSTDDTLSIIEEYQERFPNFIEIVPGGNHDGIAFNFSVLLSYSTTPYVMFCDQDDVWLPDKVMVTLNKVQELERVYGSNIPILVHTDLKVVDEGLSTLGDSFWDYQKLNPRKNTLNRLLVQNVVTGCSMMINRCLIKRCGKIPSNAVMHDWWIALVASSFGIISIVESTTVLYRQHSNNDTGAKRWNMDFIIKRISRFRKLKDNLLRTQYQANEFFILYNKSLSPELLELVYTYSHLNDYHRMKRLYCILKYKTFKIGLIRNIGLITTLCL